jgi:hypothetical protein
VRVLVDGQLATSHLDGKPIQLNPGTHNLRFETPGQDPIEESLLVVEGEKNRMVPVMFGHPPPPERQTGAPPETAPPKDLHRPIPALAFVFAGVAVAAGGGFAAFGLWGMNERDSLQSSCAPVCSTSQVSSVRTKFIVADSLLGLGIVSLGAAAYVYLGRPSVEREKNIGVSRPALPPALALGAASSGPTLTLRGEF